MKKVFTVKLTVLSIIILINIGCSKRASLIPKDRLGDGITRQIYKKLSYDKYGRLQFKNKVKALTEVNKYYYLVDRSSKTGQMKRYFKIYYVDKKRYRVLMSKPLGLIYKWTGKGFELGLEVADFIMKGTSTSGGEGAVAVLGVLTTTSGGFIYGVHKGIVETWNQLEKPFIKYRELLLGYSKISYDNKGRISKITHFTPEEKPVVITETSFIYYKNKPNPYKSMIYSKADNKKRRIYFRGK